MDYKEYNFTSKKMNITKRKSSSHCRDFLSGNLFQDILIQILTEIVKNNISVFDSVATKVMHSLSILRQSENESVAIKILPSIK